jgi:hypothetical protein
MSATQVGQIARIMHEPDGKQNMRNKGGKWRSTITSPGCVMGQRRATVTRLQWKVLPPAISVVFEEVR